MKLYRAKANGNVIHMSDEAAAVLVPSMYEEISERESQSAAVQPPDLAAVNAEPKAAAPTEPRKRRRAKSK